jgi:hypothetical protein
VLRARRFQFTRQRRNPIELIVQLFIREGGRCAVTPFRLDQSGRPLGRPLAVRLPAPLPAAPAAFLAAAQALFAGLCGCDLGRASGWFTEGHVGARRARRSLIARTIIAPTAAPVIVPVFLAPRTFARLAWPVFAPPVLALGSAPIATPATAPAAAPPMLPLPLRLCPGPRLRLAWSRDRWLGLLPNHRRWPDGLGRRRRWRRWSGLCRAGRREKRRRRGRREADHDRLTGLLHLGLA